MNKKILDSFNQDKTKCETCENYYEKTWIVCMSCYMKWVDESSKHFKEKIKKKHDKLS